MDYYPLVGDFLYFFSFYLEDNWNEKEVVTMII